MAQVNHDCKAHECIKEAGAYCQDAADVISCCQPVTDNYAQCNYTVHMFDALLH